MPLTYTPKPLQMGTAFGLASSVSGSGEEAGSSSWKKGALLRDNDSGLITESTSPVDGSGVTKRTFGLALGDATGTTSNPVQFAWIGAYTVLEGTLSDANAGTHTLAAGDKWQTYPITKSTYWYLDAQSVSASGGLVIGFKDAVGTVDGRVYFLVTAACRGGVHAASAAI